MRTVTFQGFTKNSELRVMRVLKKCEKFIPTYCREIVFKTSPDDGFREIGPFKPIATVSTNYPYGEIQITLYDVFFRLNLRDQTSHLVHEFQHVVLMPLSHQFFRLLALTNLSKKEQEIVGSQFHDLEEFVVCELTQLIVHSG